ncbi:hypothetical protein KDA11_00810, partial [Candidatus Saccharibacteria bacterium]|nr:hypothetical protein [Candidatus Saccharibacteria bacterium]
VRVPLDPPYKTTHRKMGLFIWRVKQIESSNMMTPARFKRCYKDNPETATLELEGCGKVAFGVNFTTYTFICYLW